MALSRSDRAKSLLSCLSPFRAFERYRWTIAEEECRAQSSLDLCQIDISKWQKLDARKLGVERSMISKSCQNVLKNLQRAGYEAYLVGGCVRDLILKRVPKDFDVITTAKLKQVKRQFKKALIVGQRFPICRVIVGDCLVEVSSFSTAMEKSKRKQVCISDIPAGCDEKDFTLWRNCMQRDFSINSIIMRQMEQTALPFVFNILLLHISSIGHILIEYLCKMDSLFYDPFSNTIFDYIDAIKDLKSLKLKTLIPAHLAFEEDPAKILRGLRFAARLNLTFSEEIEAAIFNLSSAVARLGKCRINLEMNNMLSYGAAAPSLLLLRRFKLLEVFLPFQEAYLSMQAANQLDDRSLMLVKLFSNLDRMITCNQPCDGSLWMALLAFHLALFNNPQNAAVVLTLASLLYHGNWEESIEYARQYAPAARVFVPEILDAVDSLSDHEIAERVAQFAAQVNDSLNVFIDMEYALEARTTWPEFRSSGLVFISRRMCQKVKEIFLVFVEDFTSLKAPRRHLDLDYCSLTQGKIYKTRFFVGKIIMDTLVSMDSVEGVNQVANGDRRNYAYQKLKVYKHRQVISQASTSLEREESMRKDENKRMVPTEICEALKGKKESFYGDGKQGNECSELSDCGLSPDKTENDEHDKPKLRTARTLLSHLFK